MTRRLTTILVLLFAMTIAVMAKQDYVLVIDAGHGGKDAGAVGAFSREKDINLKTALAFGRYVERNCRDVKVIYTRKKDVFIELYERANIANKNHANVFISIHTNALPKGHVGRGVETYSMTLRRSEEKLSAAQRENSVITYEKDYEQHYAGYDSNSAESEIMFEYIHDDNMAKSVELAKSIQKSLCASANRPDKGVKQDNFHVLRRTSMPACLVELGFISTPDEERLLNDDVAIDRMAYGIYVGFVKYKDKTHADIAPYKPMQQAEPANPTPAEQPMLAAQPSHRNEAAAAGQQPAMPSPQVVKEEPAQAQNAPERTARPESQKVETQPAEMPDDGQPLFKVQFLTAPRKYKAGAAQFKGITDADCYLDGETYKYTVGEYKTFSEAARMKKQIADKFPDAFVVAFRNGMRIDLNEARKMAK